jgi:hypothetical protein
VSRSPVLGSLFLMELVRAASPPTAETVSLRQTRFWGIWSRGLKSLDSLLFSLNTVLFLMVKLRY